MKKIQRLGKALLTLISLPFFLLFPWEKVVGVMGLYLGQATYLVVAVLYLIPLLYNAGNEDLLDKLSPLGAVLAGFLAPLVYLWYEMFRTNKETTTMDLVTQSNGREDVLATVELKRNPNAGDNIETSFGTFKILYITYRSNKIPKAGVEKLN